MPKSEEITITREDMAQWLREEVRRITKTSELQLKEATDFVTAYVGGKISADEAMDRMMNYDRRWGESKLLAAMPDEGTPNEEILRRLDAERSKAEESHRTRLTGKTGGRGLP